MTSITSTRSLLLLMALIATDVPLCVQAQQAGVLSYHNGPERSGHFVDVRVCKDDSVRQRWRESAHHRFMDQWVALCVIESIKQHDQLPAVGG